MNALSFYFRVVQALEEIETAELWHSLCARAEAELERHIRKDRDE
jgi:hypothetical protein